jgi:hypothetical protein
MEDVITGRLKLFSDREEAIFVSTVETYSLHIAYQYNSSGIHTK